MMKPYIKGLYSRKVWWVENLVNLANHLQFAKLKSSKGITLWLMENGMAEVCAWVYIRASCFEFECG